MSRHRNIIVSYFFYIIEDEDKKSFYDRYFSGEVEVTEDGDIIDPYEEQVEKGGGDASEVIDEELSSEESVHLESKNEKSEKVKEGKNKKTLYSNAEEKYQEKIRKKKERETEKKKRHSKIMRVSSFISKPLNFTSYIFRTSQIAKEKGTR